MSRHAKTHGIGVVASLLLLTCLACGSGSGGSDGGGDILGPPGPAPISGDWSTTATESLDTCGFDPLPPWAPLHVEESGDSVIMTFSDGAGGCEQSVRERTGDTVTLTRTDTIDAPCGTIRVTSEAVYDFTESTLSGSSTHRYSVLYGNCSNLPCTYQLSVGGTRCDACFPACTRAGKVDSPATCDAKGGTCPPTSEL
jgi:hypothetical protein